jgi:hypothetical protein
LVFSVESLNKIATKYGKRVDNWMRLKSVSAYLSQHPDWINAVEGKNGGTFAVEAVAEEFERWCKKGTMSVPHRVYFIRAVNMQKFKVGISSDPRKRLKQMQIGSPTKLVLARDVVCHDAVLAEQKIHKCFQEYHSHGEWFSCQIEKALSVFDGHFA